MGNYESRRQGVTIMRRVYPHLMRPQDYPEYSRRWAKATTRETLENTTQFAALRSFTLEDNKLVDIDEKLDLYTKQIEMGKVIWPFVSTLYADNFHELVAAIKERELYLFDFWGYVPGTNTAGQSWGQYRPPYRTLKLLHDELGDRFLGMDNGEQDGRYIGAYAHMMYPDSQDGKSQYLNFYDFFAQLTDDMGHYITVLCSLNYGHYFAKMGDHIMVGAETAQALPNNNLWYAYLRGAGKQYGLLWFGNASVWNRFGWKSYTESGQFGTYNEHGPESGTSLGLLRRLMYTQYMYNCAILGYESGWFYSEGLEGDNEKKELAKPTPIGEVQRGCVQFVKDHPFPGVLHTPTAVLLGFYNGWTFPRHLYTDSVYKTWGNKPYDAGDHQIHALYTMIYPGYENAGFYHDERGFLTGTPFGDSIDVLFNDVRPEILDQYSLIIIAGNQKLDIEVLDKLKRFAEGGGHAVLTATHLAGIEDLAWFGIAEVGETIRVENASTELGGKQYDEIPFDLVSFRLTADAEVKATVLEEPLIAGVERGKGHIDIIASPYGLHADPVIVQNAVKNEADSDIPLYFDFLKCIKAFLGSCLSEQSIVRTGNNDLQHTTNVVDEESLVVSIANNGTEWQPFSLSLKEGEIAGVEEWLLPKCPADTPGYFPNVVKEKATSNATQKADEKSAIAPGDIRIFSLRAKNLDVKIQSPVKLRDRADDRYLSLWSVENLRDRILTTERLGQHFDGIKIEAKYLLEADSKFLAAEGEFFRRTKLHGIVDFVGLLNYYPKLTLIENLEYRQRDSIQAIAEIFNKMRLLGMDKALFALHRNSENSYTLDQAKQSFLNSYTELADIALDQNITLYIMSRPLVARTILWNLELPGVTTNTTLEFINTIDRENVKFCLDTSHALMVGEKLLPLLEEIKDKISLLSVSAPLRDPYGQWYNIHGPLSGSEWETEMTPLVQLARGRYADIPICLNAVYQDWEAVYRDIRLISAQ